LFGLIQNRSEVIDLSVCKCPLNI
jgi:CheY-like chemotaxis protein